MIAGDLGLADQLPRQQQEVASSCLFDQAASGSDQSMPAVSASVGRIERTTATSQGEGESPVSANGLLLIEAFLDRLFDAGLDPAEDRGGYDPAPLRHRVSLPTGVFISGPESRARSCAPRRWRRQLPVAATHLLFL